jgi:hypothetical protein
MKNPSDPLGNRTHPLPACGAVSQPTAPQRAPADKMCGKINIFNEKNDFLRSTNCKIWSQIKENSTNDCDVVFEFVIPLNSRLF